MKTYRNPNREPVDLASGRIVHRGQTVTLPPEGSDEIAAHDQGHIDTRRLVEVPAVEASPTGDGDPDPTPSTALAPAATSARPPKPPKPKSTPPAGGPDDEVKSR